MTDIKDKRPQIRQIIDAIYQKDNKYMKKPRERSSLLNTNDIIFDLSRAANINNLLNGADQQEQFDSIAATGQQVIKTEKNGKDASRFQQLP